MIAIVLNEKRFEIPEHYSCMQLIALLNYNNIRLAIEVNGYIIPKSQYKSTIIKAADKIEIVKAVGGG